MTDADLQNKGVAPSLGHCKRPSRTSGDQHFRTNNHPCATYLGPGTLRRDALVLQVRIFYNVREKEGIAHPPGQEEYAPGAQPKEEK
jgi:hypothetical protein